MPNVSHPQFSPPLLQFNGHLQTILPAISRVIQKPGYQRERIDTPDGDFLDLDWLKAGHSRLVVLSHGLEGDSHRPYIKGMVHTFSRNGFDVLAWNFRSCSGEMNKQPRFYHAGATDDLAHVVNHAIHQHGYTNITLVGFSLGGNMTLKYMGELGNAVPWPVTRAITFSVPIDLYSSLVQIQEAGPSFYSKRFLISLKQKVKDKAKLMPHLFDLTGIDQITQLQEFDNRFTATLHGFKDALDYYTQCSALQFMEGIQRPTLLVNALNDPFLSDKCFPEQQFKQHPFVYVELPQHGGHCGFSQRWRFKAPPGRRIYWSEARALAFACQTNL